MLKESPTRHLLNKIIRMSSIDVYSHSVDAFMFHDYFIEDNINNGAIFNNIYLPVELLVQILFYVDAKEILRLSLVCKKWCNIIKSELLWSIKYMRNYHRNKFKKLPWYVYYCLFTTNYFDTNLLKNGNGQEKFKYWVIAPHYYPTRNFPGYDFKIEEEPIGCRPLPTGVSEFNGCSSCFAAGYYQCKKLQIICVKDCNLMLYILNKFKPHIYASEWVSGKYNFGCHYILSCQLLGEKKNNSKPPAVLFQKTISFEIDSWPMLPWRKLEVVLKDYPDGTANIVFEHNGAQGSDATKLYEGCKMAGGVVKILFDSIEPI